MTGEHLKYLFIGGDVIFLFVFIVSFMVRYKINERRFNRRNIAGVEMFQSYGNSFLTRFWEGAAYKIAGFFQGAMVIALLGSLFFIFHS